MAKNVKDNGTTTKVDPVKELKTRTAALERTANSLIKQVEKMTATIATMKEDLKGKANKAPKAPKVKAEKPEKAPKVKAEKVEKPKKPKVKKTRTKRREEENA